MNPKPFHRFSDVQVTLWRWSMCKCWIYVTRRPHDKIASVTMWSIRCIWIRADHKSSGEKRCTFNSLYGRWWEERSASLSQFNGENFHKRWSNYDEIDHNRNQTNSIFHLQLYICWMDKQTLEEVTYRRYGSVHPWPLNHIQNWRKRSAVVKKLKVFNWTSYTNEQVIKKVRKCCAFLKDKLGNNQYFYGDR